jgi:hypothetical protein
VDAGGETVGEELLRRDEVDVLDGGGRARVEVRVVAGELAAVGVHPPRNPVFEEMGKRVSSKEEEEEKGEKTHSRDFW